MAASKLLVVFLLFALPGSAQVSRYVVFFKDKGTTPYSIDQPLAFLSTRSIDRRNKQKIDITTDDLPVDPVYVAGVRATGAFTFFTSRWRNAVLIEVDAGTIDAVRSLPYVASVEFVAPGHRLASGRVGKGKDKNNVAGMSTPATAIAQLQQLGMDEMHGQGYHGEGMSIAILDGGFLGVDIAVPFSSLFENGQVKLAIDYVRNSGNVYQYDEHGTEVLSTIAANVPGTFVGGASGANLYLFVTEDVASEYKIEEYNWLFAAEKADSAGVDIISTSLGYTEFDDPAMNYTFANLTGNISVVTRAAVQAMAVGMAVVCSAGNEGQDSWHYITPPADADEILSVGAVNIDGVRVPFSSVGPTADGRVKPDVMALGYGTAVILPDGSVGTRNGTSFACPLVASLAAGVWQAYPELSVRDLFEAILNSGDQASHPDNLRGYGIPNFQGVVQYLAEHQQGVEIYPNPVTEETLHIRLKDPTNDTVLVTIFDGVGRKLSESAIQGNSHNSPLLVNVNGMAAGLYLIRIESPTVTKTFRWIKA